MLFTSHHFSHINVKCAELVHLSSQSPPTARVSSTVTYRSVSVLPTVFNFLGFEYQDGVLQLCMLFFKRFKLNVISN